MPADSVFYTNCDLYSSMQPKVAFLLPYHDTEDCLWAETEKGELNLIGRDGLPIHDPKGAKEEALRWRHSLSFGNLEVLYVYGIGLGYYYDVVQAWLREDSKRHAIFLEDDLSVFFRFLETSRATELLRDQQVYLRYSEDLLEDKALFDWLCWDFLQRKVAVSALQSYAIHREEYLQALTQKIHFDHHRTNEAIDEYLDHGISYYKNFYANIHKLPHSANGAALYGQFTGIPAIICGAGPSLENALPHLAQLQDKALLFAGGSAINALNHEGIQPQFGAGVDPNSAQFQRLSRMNAWEVPFFFRPRMHRDALSLLHGPLLYVPGGGGYQTAAWFEAALGIDTDIPAIDEGHNVVNLCTSLAVEMGCNPIIFVGLDLAYTGMRLYAPGVLDEAGVSAQDILNDQRVDRAAVVRKDIHGQPIYTLWKWIAEADWLAQLAEKQSDTTFINTTGAGIGISHVPNKDLKSLLADMPIQEGLAGRCWQQVAQALLPPEDSSLLITEAMKKMEESLEQCVQHFSSILEQLQLLAVEVEEQPEKELDLHTGMLALIEVELETEPAFSYVLSIFNEVYLHLLNREFTALSNKNVPVLERNRGLLKLAVRRQAFLRETARTNLQLLRASSTREKVLKENNE